MNKIFTECLPKSNHNGKTGINWKESIGVKVTCVYNDKEFEVEIINYISKKQLLTIKYNNKEFDMYTSNFIKGKFGVMLGKITKQFKIEIGTNFKDYTRDITIIDREYRANPYNKGKFLKYYKYHCNKCQNEDWIVENSLLKGTSCNACCVSSNKINEELNSVWNTNPELLHLFENIEDAKVVSIASCKKKVWLKCPCCGNLKYTKMNSIYRKILDGYFPCNKCSDKQPYPEKFMFAVLEQLDLDFKTQLTKTTFEWCDKYKYDFYFELNNEQYIIETNGRQHYEECWNFKSNKKARNYKEEVKINDRIKKELALVNGIKEENYIVIDCRYSDLEYIKQNILNSKLAKLFDLSKIDWLKAEEFALSNRVKEACDYKNNNNDLTCTEISKLMKLSVSTIINYLKRGNGIWCNYNAEEEKIKNHSKFGELSKKKNSKPVEIFKDGISLGIFPSAKELERQSETLFGIKLLQGEISTVCRAERNYYKSYAFKLKEDIKWTIK